MSSFETPRSSAPQDKPFETPRSSAPQDKHAVVPGADFASYYGRPILKRPVWKQPDVAGYLFFGGVAGVSAVLAEGAALSGRPHLERSCRLLAAGGSSLGTVFLVHDLGRPERFLNMLRVFKPTSPLSVGSWILAPFTGFSQAAAASMVTGRLPTVGRISGAATAVLGPVLSTYTAALISNTAVPAWHEAYREMPFLFAGSASAAAGGLAMASTPLAESGPARRVAVAGAVVDLASMELLRRRLGELAGPYEHGRPGTLLAAARALTVAGGVGSILGRRSRLLSAASGAMLAAGSLLTRFGVFQAGLASAENPAYVVKPQRERLAGDDTHTASIERTLAG
jgi:hypothetical protein